MDWRKIAQAMSNTAASNVSGPVDLLTFALQKAGLPVPDDTVMSSKWLTNRGLMAPVKPGVEQVIGDTLGLLSPMVAAAKTQQIARGLLTMGENATAPAMQGAMGQRGAIGDFPKAKRMGNLPNEPGTAEVPDGFVRLYHQTSPQAAKSIKHSGLSIEHAKGIEGPRAVYASETGFYGAPGSRPTVEFMVPKDKWDDPFVLQDVAPKSIAAVHLPWHSKARYILDNPDVLAKTLKGEFDDLTGDYAPAVRYIKATYGRKQ